MSGRWLLTQQLPSEKELSQEKGHAEDLLGPVLESLRHHFCHSPLIETDGRELAQLQGQQN